MHILLQPINHIPDDVLNALERELPEIFPDASFHVNESVGLLPDKWELGPISRRDVFFER